MNDVPQFKPELKARTTLGVLAAASIALAMAASSITRPLANASHPMIEGMWSDPPATAIGMLCRFICTDASIDRLNALLDDPANDARPFVALQDEAQRAAVEQYLKPRLTPIALNTFPVDPADDPGFLRCEPWGFARQIFAPHDLEIRQRGNRLELRYAEWDARRTVYMDGRAVPANAMPTRLGYSIGHWDDDALVIETTGIAANIAQIPSSMFRHSDQLRAVERYTKASDGTLWLTTTLTDSVMFREPLVLKHVWKWAPTVKIYRYADCKPATDFKRGVKP
jgi:hypothetical protein